MGKMEYLDALKRAMTGLPPETQAKTLAYYEQRFVDGMAAGRSEEDVGRELDEPRKIAMTLRASSRLDAFNEKKTPANLARVLVCAAGLAIFNLFMVVPAAVFGALLTALYACAFAFYLAGILVTASGLAGTNEFVFNAPLGHVVISSDGVGQQGQDIIEIGRNGVQVFKDRDAAQPGVTIDEENDPDTQRVIRARSGAGRIHITTGMDESSRTAQTVAGAGLVLGAIALFLMALVVTRYTFVGIKRYVQMNLYLLKGI
jgi:uncharacterized membrane protein